MMIQLNLTDLEKIIAMSKVFLTKKMISLYSVKLRDPSNTSIFYIEHDDLGVDQKTKPNADNILKELTTGPKPMMTHLKLDFTKTLIDVDDLDILKSQVIPYSRNICDQLKNQKKPDDTQITTYKCDQKNKNIDLIFSLKWKNKNWALQCSNIIKKFNFKIN